MLCSSRVHLPSVLIADPLDDPKAFNTFYSALQSAKRTLDICVFTITDDRVAKLLLEAHKKGVQVRIISDDEKSLDKGADIELLRNSGIPVKIDDSPFHMHNKFAIIGESLHRACWLTPVDNALILNGSFNWTRSAADANNENIIVQDSPILIANFRKEFDRLWDAFQ